MSKTIYTKEYKTLTEWLRQSREDQGLSMRAFGKILGKPHSYVGKVEQGERRLDVIEYIEYCNCLGISPEVGIKLLLS
ncbi:MAG: transcriptional regulator [Gammaproteobacteria bacterium]|nr:transcriptional regulator [Gammaproteobacteria bacterium]